MATVLEISETCSVLLDVRTEPVGKRLADGSQEQCAVLEESQGGRKVELC